MTKHCCLAGLLAALTPALASAAQPLCQVQQGAGNTGISAIWVLANIAYAGMRAQGNPSRGWRVVSFILGLPGTLVSRFAVREGGERAYGIDLPRRRDGNGTREAAPADRP